MVQYKHRLNQLVKGLKRKNSEDGAVAVIVALVMVVLLGFAAVAIDEGSWWDAQAEYQNAADAAALAAANKKYNSGEGTIVTDSDASKAGAAIAQQIFSDNGLQLYYNDENGNPDEISFSYDSKAKDVTVTISKDTGNYFSKTLSGKDTTLVKVTAVAGLDEASEENENPFGQRSAIESYDTTNWNSGNDCVVTGGITTGGSFSDQCGTVYDGDISSDGNILIDPPAPTTIKGSIKSGGNFTLSTSGCTVTGDIIANGNIAIKNGSTSNFKNIVTNSNIIDLQHSNIDGSVLVGGNFNSEGVDYTTIANDLNVNGNIKFKGNNFIVNGNYYDRGSANLYEYQHFKTSDGNDTNVIEGTDDNLVANRAHDNYIWKYDSLAKYLDYDTGTRPYTVVTQEMVDEFNKQEKEQAIADGKINQYGWWQVPIVFDGRNLILQTNDLYQNGDYVQEFFDFCKHYSNGGKGDGSPIYILGNFTSNINGPIVLDEALVAGGDITTYSSSITTAKNGIALISMNGNLYLGNQNGNTFNGSIMTLGEGKEIVLTTNGTVNGGIISHGDILMTGKWAVTADTSWQQSVKKTSTIKKRVIRLRK